MSYSTGNATTTFNGLTNVQNNYFSSATHGHGGVHNSSGLGQWLLDDEELSANVWFVKWNGAQGVRRPVCHPGTRRALTAWVDSQAGSVVWISGWTGTGKTIFARTMAAYWAGQNRLGASYFFGPGPKDCMTSTQLLPALIAHQLSERVGVLPLQRPRVVNGQQLPPGRMFLDECHCEEEQIHLLDDIFNSVGQLGASVKFVISSRPTPRLEDKFNTFVTFQDQDIEHFLRASFDQICRIRRPDSAMSSTDGPWPSTKQIKRLVAWASGQFTFAHRLVETIQACQAQDPVEVLRRMLDNQALLFEDLDAHYLTIICKAETTIQAARMKQVFEQQVVDRGAPIQICDLLLHVTFEPSSLSDMVLFWFVKTSDIGIALLHLRAILVRPFGDDGPVEFWHRSFRDFLLRPHKPHEFSLKSVDTGSKSFFFLRRLMVEHSCLSATHRNLSPSQWLGYVFLCCNNRQVGILPTFCNILR
ncbi:hypothetical protein BDN72DRAFT_901423 [Pluteus cervinus]|uniref:Uncharacterized protein n=1 Tax=Pluteus cervinus TaxID=181527 RepID=A0ACD3AFX6_9AGAR|nr:hypothetical protein BDN72DRAFT_901423 [Pluteus cervinus]